MIKECDHCNISFETNRSRQRFCSKDCYKLAHPAYQKNWYASNLEHNREVRRSYSYNYERSNPLQRLISYAKRRSNKLGVEFSICSDDVVLPEICPVLKQKMAKNERYAASLDRIDPSKGYIPGNVQVMSKKANIMKNDATIEELLDFARWVLTTYG